MKIPKLSGLIKRRFLLNYRIDPQVLKEFLPAPFKPKLYDGYGIGGICLIRLENIKPDCSLLPFGISSENAAHRFAVTWGDDQEGVYIPRRDSNSRLNNLAGGRLFPGVHHFARFDIKEDQDSFEVKMQAKDGKVDIGFKGTVATTFPSDSCFSSLAEASDFFERGSLGYSDTNQQGDFHGITLQVKKWEVSPFEVTEISSNFFDDQGIFPADRITFDHGLIMRDIEHEWQSEDDICSCEAIP
ncbi:MAG: DUF2071 domain-containing protein [Lentisphaeria bacterium]|nr:DUF2071 domain-containing protein [Lentisphaeria bacterium]